MGYLVSQGSTHRVGWSRILNVYEKIYNLAKEKNEGYCILLSTSSECCL